MIEVVVIPQFREQSIEVKQLDGSLSSLQGEVGGSIEYIPVDERCDFIVNEEGAYTKMLNPRAIFWYFNRTGREVRIYGSVILVGKADQEGDDTSVPRDIIKSLII